MIVPFLPVRFDLHCPVRNGSVRFDLFRSGSVRDESVLFFSSLVWLVPVRFGQVQSGSVRNESYSFPSSSSSPVRLVPVRLVPARFGPVLSGSVRFGSK